jgi:hypothetical protein
MHGGRAGAPSGKANGGHRTGAFTCQAIAERKHVSRLLKAWRSLKNEMEDA